MPSPASHRPLHTIVAAATATATLIAGGLAATAASASGSRATPQRLVTVLNGADLQHSFTPVSGPGTVTETLSAPDDITRDGSNLFTAFQNGVGPQGQPSTSGNTDSTVVEFTATGHVLGQWDVTGKVDGLTADPDQHLMIATANEDANSSLYTISERSGAVRHYAYSIGPLLHNGGTDAISVFHDAILISASAPGTVGSLAALQASFPAAYRADLDPSSLTATLTPIYGDEATATVVTAGSPKGNAEALALTDPDSNAVVPNGSPRFAGDFELTSQADAEQIYTPDPLSDTPKLSVLNLTQGGQPQSVDDTAWATGRGTLVFTDNSNGTVDALSGAFSPGTAYVAVTPCGLASAPATCPAPGYPANFLGTLNLWSGAVTPVTLPDVGGVQAQPQGMLFVPAAAHGGHGNH
ncbi:MAG: hypothetical protein ACRDJU_08875 [Actinomycetota bacterium]